HSFLSAAMMSMKTLHLPDRKALVLLQTLPLTTFSLTVCDFPTLSLLIQGPGPRQSRHPEPAEENADPIQPLLPVLCWQETPTPCFRSSHRRRHFPIRLQPLAE